MIDPADYRYEHFRTRQLLHDLAFSLSAPKAGEPFPDFDLETTRGEWVSKKDFVHERPLLLITASITCPNTQAAMEPLRRLYGEFGNEVAFLMVNVREAHPGQNYPQPRAYQEKVQHARALESSYELPWEVAVENLDGDLDRYLDGKPNAAWIMNTEGRIAFRSHWARDERGLRQALEAIGNGLTPPRPKSSAMLLPVARAMGHLDDVLSRAGPQAWRDMWKAGFPIGMAGKLAPVFRPLSPDDRGIAAMVTLLLGSVTGAALVTARWRKY